ncbi:NADH-quinone oxidoreductase subunit I [Labeo rohita]|uniref:NADH-quinone oxidoreductase subunit I n=1 Tax=Labeo rohita TaxID=84645 RepID=A0ABQ8L896_LABRO|nr:NADH-quinone oxidoreductase subunit I [Labeo rohita]
MTASSFYSIFTQVPKTFNSAAALQVGFLKHPGDFVTVLLFCLFCFFMSFQTDWMMMRSDLCAEHWLLSDSLCKQKSHWIITINGKQNVWKCNLIFPTDRLQQKTDFFNSLTIF